MRDDTCGRTSLADQVIEQDGRDAILSGVNLSYSRVCSAFEATKEELGRHFRAAPIFWAHNIVTGPVYCCSKRSLISAPETRQA